MPDIYRYRILSASSADGLSEHVNTCAKGVWELVPGQSVTVATYRLSNTDQQPDIRWIYSVIMRSRA